MKRSMYRRWLLLPLGGFLLVVGLAACHSAKGSMTQEKSMSPEKSMSSGAMMTATDSSMPKGTKSMTDQKNKGM